MPLEVEWGRPAEREGARPRERPNERGGTDMSLPCEWALRCGERRGERRARCNVGELSRFVDAPTWGVAGGRACGSNRGGRKPGPSRMR